MTLEQFLDRLENVRRAGPAMWAAACPAHEDRVASMNVTEGDDGRVLVHCHAGCGFQEIVDSLRLTPADLFLERSDPVQRHQVHRPAPRPEPEPTGATDHDIDVWCRHLRRNDRLIDRLGELKGWTFDALCDLDVGWDGKRLVLPVRNDEWVLRGLVRYQPGGTPKTLAEGPRNLWPPPEEMPDDAPLLLVEGESDVISAFSLGVNAVGLPGAAKWDDSWPARFHGHSVVVMLDCDDSGRRAAARAATELSAVTWVRRVDLAPDRDDGFDLGDLLLAQREKGQLEALSARLKALLAD